MHSKRVEQAAAVGATFLAGSDSSQGSSSFWRPPTSLAKRPPESQLKSPPLNLSLLLPLIIIFLLPTFTLDLRSRLEPAESGAASLERQATSNLLILRDLLVDFIRLPYDRVRLSSGSSLIATASAKEINTKLDLQEEETHMRLAGTPVAEARTMPGYGQAHQQVGVRSPQPMGPNQDYQGASGEQAELGAGGGPGESAAGQAIQAATGGPLETRSDLPAVRALNVKCEKNHMTVNIVFDRPFYGMVFSKGHYNDQKCVHLPANSGQSSVNFDIHLGKCGMSSSEAASQALLAPGGSNQPNGLFIENTIIIQYDPQVQEIYDQARKLRCTWYDYYEKSVTFRPYNVDMMDAVTANFLGDNIQCWMQIQVGKGPWASEVAGIVKIGQTMTMVLAIKDDENRFDMLVRNCVASDGKHQPIQLVDEYGCVARPKIMGKFQKVRNFGPAATVVSYAHFQAFKFPDSMSVHFQCVIQVCRYECPVPQCSGQPGVEQPGELAAGGGGPPGDYAASGTEIVSSKEAVPPATGYFSANRSAVNLKLDESLGRVQVKLDTSMMTGSGGGRQQQQALPPHLLHASTASEYSASAAGAGSLAAPQAATPPYFRAAATGGAGRPAILAGAPAGRLQAPPSGSASHFSAPYPSSAALYANRIGDQETEPDGQQAEQVAGSGLPSDSSPLTLIASPRALRTSSSNQQNLRRLVPYNHRYRRAAGSNETRSREPRSPAPDSTNIRTQRTIQVVSPDDVAFSLLSPGEEQLLAGSAQRGHALLTRRPQRPEVAASQDICFSAGKFALGILVSLAALTSTMVAVVYFALRQRATSHEKLATCYFEPSPESSSSSSSRILAEGQLEEFAAASQLRQQQELQQRNKYLARLYSQFAPANYWQQQR